MAIGDPYASLAQLKDYLSAGSTSAFPTSSKDSKLTDCLNSASEWINQACSRQFNQSTVATARDFEPEDWTSCELDDFWTTTGLIVQSDTGGDGSFEVTLDATEYELEPFNALMYGLPWPYSHVRSVGGMWFPKIAFRRRATVRVTAQWGWPAVPAPVHEACLLLAAREYKLRTAPLGVSGETEYGSGIRTNQVQDLRRMLVKYMKYPYMGGA